MLDDHYFVFKRADLNTALNLAEKRQLRNIGLKVARARIDRGAVPSLPCVVIEADWPEYEATTAALEARLAKGS